MTIAVLLLGSCGSGPLDDRVGASRLTTRVGPGGATVRGEGGGALEGFTLVVPPGALDAVVEIAIEPGPDIRLPGTAAAAPGLTLRATPDVGLLRLPATLELAVDLPGFGRGEDLVVAGLLDSSRFGAAGSAVASERITLLADRGSLDRAAGRYSFELSRLGALQVRRSLQARLTADAEVLTDDGFAALVDGSSEALLRADAAFAAAQQADPHFALGNLFRALSRVAVVLDDRRDLGPSLDSVGELLTGFGLDVGRESLWSRLRSGNLPTTLPRARANVPSMSAVQVLLVDTLRPVLAASLQDLDRVPAGLMASADLPSFVFLAAGVRDIDDGDLLALRAALTGSMAAIDLLDALDLELDAFVLSREIVEGSATLQTFFDDNPAFGRRRSAFQERSFAVLAEALDAAAAASASIEREADDQADDVVTFAAGSQLANRSRLRSALGLLLESVVQGAANAGGTQRRVDLGPARGGVDVDLGAPFRDGLFEPRQAVPEFLGCFGLSGTVERPDLAGVLPGMTQARATDLLQLADRRALPPARATIDIDGLIADWPAGAALLEPRDPIGDPSGGSGRGVDLESMFFAVSGDEFAFRLSVGDDLVAFYPTQEARYELRIRDRESCETGVETVIAVVLDPVLTVPVVTVTRDGVAIPVRASAAIGGTDVEVAVSRFELFDPDEPIRERVLRGFAQARVVTIDAEGGTVEVVDSDSTRAAVVTF